MCVYVCVCFYMFVCVRAPLSISKLKESAAKRVERCDPDEEEEGEEREEGEGR